MWMVSSCSGSVSDLWNLMFKSDWMRFELRQISWWSAVRLSQVHILVWTLWSDLQSVLICLLISSFPFTLIPLSTSFPLPHSLNEDALGIWANHPISQSGERSSWWIPLNRGLTAYCEWEGLSAQFIEKWRWIKTETRQRDKQER